MPSRAASRFAILAAILLVLPLCALQAPSPGVHPVSGRKFANVMGVSGAPWLVRPERIEEEQPDRALDELQLKRGMVVADIGAGVGYMSIKMARRVGPAGTVYANDIQPEMLVKMRQNMAKEKVTNIVPVLGEVADPKLPGNTMDLVLLVDVYHEFSEPQAMLRKIRECLKADGRLVLLEYRAEDPNVPIIPEHKMTVAQVKMELGAEGFTLSQAIETLPRQHILILTKTKATAASSGR